MSFLSKSNFVSTKYIIILLLINLYFLSSSITFSDVKKLEINKVYDLLQEKKFFEGIQELKLLSSKNNVQAQLLYSKILFSGDITPQDFENSYFWASSSFLGGLKKSKKIIDKLNDYLTVKQIDNIKVKLKLFLEKRAFVKDKRAIIQIAKFYESYINPPDMINAYTWYNIAVANGIKSAKNKRNETLGELNEKDLLEAQTLSIKIFKQINN